jgi:hypothetical protein
MTGALLKNNSYLSKPALPLAFLVQNLQQCPHKIHCELHPARAVKVSAKKMMTETVLGAGIVIYDIDAATSVLVMVTKRYLFCISTLHKPPLSVGGGK